MKTAKETCFQCHGIGSYEQTCPQCYPPMGTQWLVQYKSKRVRGGWVYMVRADGNPWVFKSRRSALREMAWRMKIYAESCEYRLINRLESVAS